MKNGFRQMHSNTRCTAMSHNCHHWIGVKADEKNHKMTKTSHKTHSSHGTDTCRLVSRFISLKLIRVAWSKSEERHTQSDNHVRRFMRTTIKITFHIQWLILCFTFSIRV